VIICNTSPLIALAILNRIDLLDTLYGEWFVPAHAAHESTVDLKPFSKLLAEKLIGHVVDLGDDRVVEALCIPLDRGEAEVIALAEAKECGTVLIDDRKGRRIAALRGLSVIGSVGVLLQARRRGLIIEVRPLLDMLIANEIRIAPSLYTKALELAGE